MNKEVRKAATAITKELSDKGMVIEGGWRAFLVITGAPQFQHNMLREAYYAGAQHLFGSIMSILEEGTEPTEADLKRVTLIHQELERWVQSHKKEN